MEIDMYLGEYLNDDSVVSLEKSLTKENFSEISLEIYRILFNEEPHASIFSGWKFFHTRKDLWNNFFNYPIPKNYPFTNVELYEKGLHLFRIFFSRYAGKFRANGLEGFDDGIGIFKFENFLDNKFQENIKSEILKFPKQENKRTDNSFALFSPDSYLYKLVESKGIFELLCKAVRRDENDSNVKDFYHMTTFVQRLQNSPNNGDIQKVCHSDVFYPCVKYWYFPWEVSDGCFMYAENGVKLTKEILDFHYNQSILVAKDSWDRKRNKGHGEGSFRAFDEDLEKMNLKLIPQIVPGNTLVIANVSGFHCRGEVNSFSERNALHGAIRMEDCFNVD